MLKNQKGEGEVFILLVIVSVVMAVGLMMWILPTWNVWRQGLSGEAALKKAQQTRQIIVEQAKAEKEAAQMRAEATAIVGKAAQEYPEYRQQEFIGAFAQALESGTISQIIYVPTEANIPIMEAGKRPSLESKEVDK